MATLARKVEKFTGTTAMATAVIGGWFGLRLGNGPSKTKPASSSRRHLHSKQLQQLKAALTCKTGSTCKTASACETA
jgi:hypothetical protein